MHACGYRFAWSAVLSVALVAPAGAQSPTPTASFPSTVTTPTASGITVPPSTFGNLFRDTVVDFSRIPTRENLLILAVGAVAASVSHPFDARVSTSLSMSPRAGRTFQAGETIGSAAVQLAAAMATQTIGRASGNSKIAALGTDLLRAQLVAQAMTAGIKLTARRTRPDGSMYSFPSGHSASAFATATVVQRDLGWKFGVPAYALATYVAASRVQVQRHYLSDVTLGAALGIIAGRSVTVGRGNARFALAPTGVPGGAGVSFTWIGRY